MKNTKKSANLITLALLTAIGVGNVANAHDVNGALRTASSAIDYYQVHCFDEGGSGPTAHLSVAVKNNTNSAAKLSIQAIRDNGATNSTDAVNANAAYSPNILQAGGDGYFYLTVNKTAAGAVNYSIQFHCQTSDNQHSGTDIVQLTNQ
jgi:hypothetical protein